MSDIAIRVEGLGKQYFIGQGKQARYATLSERLTGIITSPLRSIQSVLRGQSSAVASERIWALKDVSFEVKHGDVIGIIGRNGAGKSTLLKILSQITEPTEGFIDMYGRIGALLEVGTGFHPELTGRENVYLNGAILGMKRREIKRKFDEIVDFSGVEKFIDTPVKHYSSGMQVRLAFAVAAHLEPEILVVDEVLAVGDAEFQKKCLGKMNDVSQSGRTVLFVSHNMGAVESLCEKALVLEYGTVAFAPESAKKAVEYYLATVGNSTDKQTKLSERIDRKGNGDIRFVDFAMFDDQGKQLSVAFSGQYIELRLYYKSMTYDQRRQVKVMVGIRTLTDILVCRLNNDWTDEAMGVLEQEGYLSCIIPKLSLTAGLYVLNIAIWKQGVLQDQVFHAASLEIQQGDFYGTGQIPEIDRNIGYFLVDHYWSLRA